MNRWCALAALLLLTGPAAAKPKQALALPGADTGGVLTHDPGPGTLPLGATVLVDDHSCPAGQIKQVTDGNATRPRTHECIAR